MNDDVITTHGNVTTWSDGRTKQTIVLQHDATYVECPTCQLVEANMIVQVRLRALEEAHRNGGTTQT